MEKIENRKLTPAERIARKQETEAKAKVETEAKARETAEEAIASAYEMDKITGQEATDLQTYIGSVDPKILVGLDIAQMMIMVRAKAEAEAKADTPQGKSRRNWLLQFVRKNPGKYSMKELSDMSDDNPVWAALTTKPNGLLSEGWFVERGSASKLTPTDKLKNANLDK